MDERRIARDLDPQPVRVPDRPGDLTAVSASSVSRTLWSVPGPDRMFVRVVNSLGQSAGPTR